MSTDSSIAQHIIEICNDQWPAQKSNCSGFVEAVAKVLGVTLTGVADDIYTQIQSQGWTAIPDGVSAKAAADSGLFVIAALTGDQEVPPQVHGHVCVVVSGPLDDVHNKYPTGYWGSLGGVGCEMTTLNYAWNVASRDLVQYASTIPTAIANAPLAIAVNGTAVANAQGYLSDNEAYAWVRPVVDALGAEVVSFNGTTVTVSLGGDQEDLSVQVQNSESFIHLGELRSFQGVDVEFDAANAQVNISTSS
jgi:hypothetical protein